ncbi:MAG: hypothetical protein LBP96_00740, partial [Bacteroidales bacterium]|nr:hypothetical protein [Bacteroidales bacterium]
MKKYSILLLSIALTLTLSAQNENTNPVPVWVDLQVTQHVGLNKWSNVDYVNEGLPNPMATEF